MTPASNRGSDYRDACRKQAMAAAQIRVPIPKWVPTILHAKYVSAARELDKDGDPMGEEYAAKVCRYLKQQLMGQKP